MRKEHLTLAVVAIVLIAFSGCAGKSYKEKECEDKTTTEEKGSCYLNFAVQDRDLQYCEQVEYKSIKENCQTKTAESKIKHCIDQAIAKHNAIECQDCCKAEFGITYSAQYATQCITTCTINAGLQVIG